MEIKQGARYSHQRTFSVADVREFGEVSGDKGIHHVALDKDGRLMVQGLLTASIGTKIGGDLNYIARQMVSDFLRPVFTGDEITCHITLTKVSQQSGFKEIEMTTVYTNQDDKEVLTGTSYGIIRDETVVE